MSDNGPISKRKRGRPPKSVDIQPKTALPTLNIPYIIGHNIEVGQFGGDGYDHLRACNGPQVEDQSDVLPVDNKDSSPSSTSQEQKGGSPENPAENKKVVSENPENYKKGSSEDSRGVTVVSTVIASGLEERMRRYVEEEGGVSGLDCVCFHCRTFRNKFVEEMRRMMGEGKR